MKKTVRRGRPAKSPVRKGRKELGQMAQLSTLPAKKAPRKTTRRTKANLEYQLELLRERIDAMQDGVVQAIAGLAVLMGQNHKELVEAVSGVPKGTADDQLGACRY